MIYVAPGKRSLLTLVMLALVGCGNEPAGAMPTADGASGSGGSAGAAGESFANRDASELFALPPLPTFELSLPPERWQYLQEHARDEEYEPAELRFRGELIGEVGLRFKGNIGTLAGCFDAEDNLTCRKLSMKVKLDAYDPKLRFFGLKRFNLHAMMRDPSLLHEKLTYDLFREVGVAAPRSSWAVATVNGVSLGLFSLVEEIDGRFTHDRWPEDGDGNLYKEAWPTSTSPEDYAPALETNEETATHEAFAAFAADLGAATDAASRRNALDQWLDLPQLARYMAVDDAIANVDGITAIYCRPDEPTACGNHNYFFYLSGDQAHFQLVPWDLDATLWPQTIYDNVPPWQVTPEDCAARFPIESDDTVLAAPGCDPLFNGLAHDLTEYDAAFEALVSGPFSVASMESAIDRYAGFIADAVAVEPGGQTVERWQSELAVLKSNIPRLQARARARRSGYTAAAVELSPSAVNDFELVKAPGLALLPSLSNLSTTTSLALAGAPASDQEALEGTQSLLLSFEYRNEGVTPWSHWINLSLPFQGRPVDLSATTGLRLTLRTDGPRTVRIDLDSNLYEAGVEGIKFGWEVEVTDAPLPTELLFADAHLPSWAHATADDLAVIRQRINALAFQPLCNGRDASGLLPDGTTDAGFLELDAIELF